MNKMNNPHSSTSKDSQVNKISSSPKNQNQILMDTSEFSFRKPYKRQRMNDDENEQEDKMKDELIGNLQDMIQQLKAKSKRDEKIIQELCKRLGLDPEEFIGSSSSQIIASDVEMTVEKNPLFMFDILPMIFKHLDENSIQVARQICKFWETEANKLVFFFNSIRVPKDFRKRKVKNLVAMDRWKDRFLKFNGTFSSITLYEPQDVETLLELKIIPCAQTERLIVKIDDDKELDVDVLVKLFQLCPGIKLLDNKHYEGMGKIMLLFVEACSKSEKQGLILTHLTSPPSRAEEFSDLEKFAQAGGRVINLWIGDYAKNVPNAGERIAKSIGKLIENSSDILEDLCLTYLDDYRHVQVTQKLPKLHTLSITEYSILQFVGTPLFGSSFKFENCPMLKSVDIVLHYSAADYDDEDYVNSDSLDKLFESCGPAETVKELDYTNPDVPEISHVQMFKTFSQIETLTTDIGYDETSNFFKLIWINFKNLKNLTFALNMINTPDLHLHFLAQITGFSKKTVKRIWKCLPSQFDEGKVHETEELENIGDGEFFKNAENVKSLRKKPSILDLPELRQLTFTGDIAWFSDEVRYILKKYAFDFMSEEFQVSYEIDKGLKKYLRELRSL